ncbi:MAG: hypothetical protein IH588_09940 [Anaerolineales bacterium]|nr:hypothetical protein [Anaerolineales bacterium]
MSQITQLGSGTIWVCNHCNIWWGSQVGNHPSTSFLKKLDDSGLLPAWDAYRGWRLVFEQASTCLECGDSIAVPALQSN